MTDTWFGADENVPPKHGRTEMAELPVLKVYGAVSLTFTVRGRAEGMLIDTHSGLPALQIPDNMEVGVRRAGDSVEVVTRPRVTSGALIAAAPDLLAALREVAELQDSAHAPVGSLWGRVNAAIAKATGVICANAVRS